MSQVVGRSVKMLQGRILGLPLGEKGLFQMVQPNDRPMPEMTASERVEYITRVLKLMWPFYIPNFCKWYLHESSPYASHFTHLGLSIFSLPCCKNSNLSSSEISVS